MVFDVCIGYMQIKTNNSAPVLDITLYDYIKILILKKLGIYILGPYSRHLFDWPDQPMGAVFVRKAL